MTESHKCTLREWQKTQKPVKDLILQASIPTGTSKNEFENFPIGTCWHFSTLPMNEQHSTQVGSHSKLVFCSLIARNDMRRRGKLKQNRASILKTISKNGIRNRFTSIKKFFHNLSEHKFTISPEGNGIDCHRHYEAILCGCIPIVEENEHMRRKYKDLPVLYTNDYSEITADYLTKKYEEMIDQEYDFKNMFFSSYSEADQTRMNEWGKFWLRKHKIPHPRLDKPKPIKQQTGLKSQKITGGATGSKNRKKIAPKRKRVIVRRRKP